jgi:hypothetical protein
MQGFFTEYAVILIESGVFHGKAIVTWLSPELSCLLYYLKGHLPITGPCCEAV